MRIGVVGCSGRVGKLLLAAVSAHAAAHLSGGFVRAKSAALNCDLGEISGQKTLGLKASSDLADLAQKSDVLIDFSTPAVALQAAEIAAKHKIALVSGTTGFSAAEKQMLAQYAEKTPILWSANMSLGVNILSMLVEQTAKILDASFDIEILEMHHRNKVDAPSGTALLLGESAAKGRAIDLKTHSRTERSGQIGARPNGEIGFATLRGGDVVGDHTVFFAGAGERLELRHVASERSLFANGALQAAFWISNKPALRLYNMQDVLQNLLV
jgi:4-hydroxy-tetrahydrodipicolinate reductase